MGRVVNFTDLQSNADGVSRESITQGKCPQADAELVMLQPGASWKDSVPAGSDGYWFALEGNGEIDARPLAVRDMAIAQEGSSVTIKNSGAAPLKLVRVLAPAPGAPAEYPGYKGALEIRNPANLQVVPVPEQKKERRFFGGHEKPGAVATDRAQSMTVKYDKETAQGLHCHPAAASMFILLDGAIEFTVDGTPTTVKPGGIAFFPAENIHASKVASEAPGALFLEFHLPSLYTTKTF